MRCAFVMTCRGLLVGGCCALVAGCAGSSTVRPMTVEVRDAATGAPVSGAVVDARPLHFFLPDYPHAIFDPSAPEGDRAITGDDGAARLAVIVDHPVEIVVCARGYATVCAELIEHPASSDKQCLWFEPNSAGGAEVPLVELRFGRTE